MISNIKLKKSFFKNLIALSIVIVVILLTFLFGIKLGFTIYEDLDKVNITVFSIGCIISIISFIIVIIVSILFIKYSGEEDETEE